VVAAVLAGGSPNARAQTLPEVPELEQTPLPPTGDGDDSSGAVVDGFDVTDGLEDLTPEEIEGHELGTQQQLPLSIGDLLDGDGLFEWEDASGATSLALLGTQAASTFGGDANDASTLASLASSAAVSYVPPHDGRSNDTSTTAQAQQQADSWFVSDTGQLFLAVGGVLVLFDSGTDDSAARAVLSDHDVPPARISLVPGLPGAYSIATSSDAESLGLVRLLAAAPGVVSVTPNLFSPDTVGDSESVPLSRYAAISAETKRMCKSDDPPLSDALSKCLWHLDASEAITWTNGNTYTPSVDINIGNVWDTTKGAGIEVSVVDATWEAGHEDLVGNSNRAASTYWGNKTGENGSVSPYHATAVAGIIGARDNSIGGRGVAPRATLLNVNYLDSQSTWHKMQAYLHRKNTVAVANHSYGAPDTGRLRRESSFAVRALEGSLESGYGGKGIVHVKGAGNGRNDGVGDELALEEIMGHRGIIAACAVNSAGTAASYSEFGSALWVCGPSGDSPRHGMLGPINKSNYHVGLRGTSYAAPVVSGVAALVRSVNSALTWRDVKLILANTAQKNDGSDSSWKAGALKHGSTTDSYFHSRKYGFGLVDASAAVAAAKTWTNLPPMLSSSASATGPWNVSSSGTTKELTLDLKSDITFVEHINVKIDMTTSHFRSMKLTLVSPSGRESLLVDSSSALGNKCLCPLNGTYKFGSARHLGESANGTWKLKIQNITGTSTTLNSWKVTAYGHNPSRTKLINLSTPVSVTEGEDIKVTVRHSGPADTTDLAVPIVLSSTTATPPGQTDADYTSLASITIPAGALEASATISTTDDDIVEVSEVIAVAIGSPPVPYRAGSAKSVEIKDNDDPLVSIKALKHSIKEGEPVEIEVTVDRDPLAPIKVGVYVTEVPLWGAYLPGKIMRYTLAFKSAGTKKITVPTVLDEVDDPTLRIVAGFGFARFKIKGPSQISINVSDDLPRVSISSDGDIDEGADASFTLKAVPVPQSPLSVKVAVEEQGFFGVDTATRTVTIPTTGTAKLAVPTVSHAFSQHDGAVIATIEAPDDDSFYLTPRNSDKKASVTVSDTVSLSLTPTPRVIEIAKKASTAYPLWHAIEPARGNAWKRALLALGESPSGVTGGKITAAEAQAYADQGRADAEAWQAVAGELRRLNSAWSGTPTVIVTGGGDITEGGDAVFTLRALPGPIVDLDVEVSVNAGGRFGVSAGTQTVTIPAGGTATLTVSTSDDGFSGPEGAVTVTVADGAAYDVYSKPSAAVTVADVGGTTPPAVPVVSVAAGSDVTEGAAASFTVSASPVPSADLVVTVSVAASGDFGVTTGRRTVSVPTTGSATLSVATSGDSIDEADGSVTVAVADTTAYDVDSSAGAATVNIADDDDPSVYVVPASLVSDVRGYAAETGNGGAHVRRWKRVLLAFGVDVPGFSDTPVALTEAQGYAQAFWSVRWDPVVEALQKLAANPQQQTPAVPTVPTVSITAGSAVVEGSAASFTVLASPAPTADLDVTVNVTGSGSFGVAAGSRTVTVPTGGSAALTVATRG